MQYTTRIDERTAQAFSRLRAPEYAPLVAYLEAQRQRTLENLAVATTEVQIFRLQGESETLKRVLELIKGAEALIAKLKT